MRDLFEAAGEKPKEHDPLADRMRPKTIEEIVGQAHILGSGKLLRQLIEADRVPSMILWGPPGTGKTTIAQVIAKKTEARFVALSAVLSGVADLREVLAEAHRARGQHGERTILFVDEIHRWSKSQQDALLGAVEKGTVTLIGATTENPSFELNSALLSRARVFVLEPLDEDAIVSLLERALKDSERGFGKQAIDIEGDVLRTIAAGSFGDARRALSALEIAVRDAILRAADQATPKISAELAEEALQHRALLYDKAGDAHYGIVSAFIKSMRGSDPDAAVYYMVRMLESGEDPRFVLRRMVIFASEDIGNADPTALSVAVNALHAFELVGMPEGVLPLTQAVTYLASAPKSNTALKAYSAARKDVIEKGPLSPPKKLLSAATRLQKSLGHGKGYRYPHDLGGVAPGEIYLPDELAGRRYYEPTDHGKEAEIKARLEAIRALGEPGEDERS
jgi:putative ATPase